MPYAFLVFAFIPSFTRMFMVFWFYHGLCPCSFAIPIGALIDVCFLFWSSMVLWLVSSLFGERFFIVWLGSDLDWRVQRVAAKFSSSELSSHQKAPPSFSRTRFSILSTLLLLRLLICLSVCILPLVAPLQLKGYTRTSSSFSPTTPSGASSAQCVLFALSTPLRLRGRIGVFRRREGSASQPFLMGSPSSASSSLCSVRGFFSSRGWPPADPTGIRPPFFIKYVFIVVFSYTRGEGQPGRPDVFPGRVPLLLLALCCLADRPFR